jgi:hypothetical protein
MFGKHMHKKGRHSSLYSSAAFLTVCSSQYRESAAIREKNSTETLNCGSKRAYPSCITVSPKLYNRIVYVDVKFKGLHYTAHVFIPLVLPKESREHVTASIILESQRQSEGKQLAFSELCFHHRDMNVLLKEYGLFFPESSHKAIINLIYITTG